MGQTTGVEKPNRLCAARICYSQRAQAHITGRLLEVVSDHNPREMADSKSACHSSGQNPAYRSALNQRLHGNVGPLAFL